MLAEKLNMESDEAECWIVNLIRNARLDAKIDSKLGHVVMGTQPTSPYQQLIEKMDTLSVRSEALQALIERKISKGKSQNVSTKLSLHSLVLEAPAMRTKLRNRISFPSSSPRIQNGIDVRLI